MKYQKKPIVIEAVRWQGQYTSPGEWPDWFNDASCNAVIVPGPDRSIIIRTLEGNMRADVGDMVIQGVKGELYPCKPEIFEALYVPVGLEHNDPIRVLYEQSAEGMPGPGVAIPMPKRGEK